jgi:hypothetical protein
LSERPALHVDAGIVELDIDREGAELYMKMGAHAEQNCSE